MKNKAIKLLSVGLCAALFLGGAGATVYAVNQSKKEPEKASVVSAPAKTADKSKNTKDESVYVLAGTDGQVRKIIVSDWIQNTLGNKSLRDSAALSEVRNVKGNESYVMDGDSMRVWDAQGKDLYLQGNIEKELPVTLRVSYLLDGKKISADDLAGKSGRVTIRYDYDNKQYEMVQIDGKSEKIAVPFAMLTGLMLDNDNFTNVAVSNGKIINDGDRTVVIGFALPGLQENLNLSHEKLTLPSYVEITADVHNFKMTNTVTVATNELFSSMDTSKLDRADELTEKINTLSEGVKKLLDGSDRLYGGLCTLLEKSDALIAGVDQLAAGAEELRNGSADVDSGVGTLRDGLSELCKNNDRLNSGMSEMFRSVLTSAQGQLAQQGFETEALTPENYQTVLKTLCNTIKKENGPYREALIAAAETGLRQQLSAAGVPQQYENAALCLIAQKMQQGLSFEEALGQVRQLLVSALGGDAAAAQALGAAAQAAASAQGQAAISMLCLSVGQQQAVGKVEAAIGQLDSVYALYDGLAQYTAGVARLHSGSNQLKAGTEKLSAGSQQLYDGILTLQGQTPALKSGVAQLRDGSMQLNAGLRELNSGVQKLSDAVNGDLSGLVTRFKATVDVSKRYQSFSGLSDGMDGQVKFIYRTDAIEKK